MHLHVPAMERTILVLLLLCLCSVTGMAWAAPDAAGKDTPVIAIKGYTFKTVDGQKLIADVHTPDVARTRPIIFWIHGGALIMGGRYITPWLRDWFVENGFVVVSFEYRLAPFVKMPEIYQDVIDAYQWTRENAKTLFNGDPERIVVGGESAGGYLTFAVAPLLKPRPPVLLALSGYGNIIAPWYSEPSDYYRRIQPIQDRDTVYDALRKNPLDGKARANFYFYTRQTGLWPNILVGHDPKTTPGEFARYCPVQQVTKDFPPVVFTHATADYDVPYSESEAMAAQFNKHGVDHQFITIKGGRHASGTIDPRIDMDGKNRKAIMDFLFTHLPPVK
ncbi:MAG: alpha/beta hydrolase [Armatimonadota bacterium]